MSVSPGILNLTFSQGATWKLALAYNNSDGDPIDLTNYSARMQARPAYTSDDVVLNLANGSGITLGGTAGTINLLVAATATAAIGAAQYVYDMELVSGSGEVTRLIEGTLVVTPEVTR
jgi:hypothetical protein